MGPSQKPWCDPEKDPAPLLRSCHREDTELQRRRPWRCGKWGESCEDSSYTQRGIGAEKEESEQAGGMGGGLGFGQPRGA